MSNLKLTQYEEYLVVERLRYKEAIVKDTSANMNVLVQIGVMSNKELEVCTKYLEEKMYVLDSEMREIHSLLNSLGFEATLKLYDSKVWAVLQTRVLCILHREIPQVMKRIDKSWTYIMPPILQ